MISKVFYMIWSEWDFGQEHCLFTTEKAAKDWIDSINRDNGLYEDGSTIDDLWDDLQGVYKVEVVA